MVLNDVLYGAFEYFEIFFLMLIGIIACILFTFISMVILRLVVRKNRK